jgi:hypothetical protein
MTRQWMIFLSEEKSQANPMRAKIPKKLTRCCPVIVRLRVPNDPLYLIRSGFGIARVML